MRKTYRQICYAEDKKDADGNWLQTWNGVSEGYPAQFHTTLGIIWRKIQSRTKKTETAAAIRPWYVDVSNDFLGFQDFAEWATCTPGYLKRDENGFLWHIDKDILAKGRREYSRETCCFVPARVNTCLLTGNRNRSLPLGVSAQASSRKLRAQIQVLGKTKFIGNFISAAEAHKAWQHEKSSEILRISKWYSDLDGSDLRVVSELISVAERISQDILAGRTTENLQGLPHD